MLTFFQQGSHYGVEMLKLLKNVTEMNMTNNNL
jgi:hypothetical protein